MDDKKPLFEDALFNVEHALGMYAYSYCTLPAEGIYNEEALRPYLKIIKACHIYIIGLLPKIEIKEVRQESRNLLMDVLVSGDSYNLKWPIPDGLNLKKIEEMCFLENETGDRFWISDENVFCSLKPQLKELNFKVLYVGQAYGRKGSRNVLDRLLRHETLQKISLKGVPDDFLLSLLLLEIQPCNQLYTMFNPRSKNNDDSVSSARIDAGLKKLFNTSEREAVALYEAALIRYFSPEFNKEFKNSFPSTNLKVLQDCYQKDFAGVFAEICFDRMPFYLYSDTIKPSPYHIAKYHLHEDSARRIFCGMDEE